ncbi:Ngl2p [Sugiyamaella lignohabitans]|uniref:Ngl2p n=1 Tax=Sugiyamaella lignohabitans TaxID=796027 RepID=A0A167DTG1_9ASCO|nr:Ngl2p [Sugiyamaella lignohabitans]ANB13274.1 Ngl2p [Sugiyamaella lignohabitans]
MISSSARSGGFIGSKFAWMACENKIGNNKRGRVKGPPPNLTPEYIAEQRAIREAKKQAKKAKAEQEAKVDGAKIITEEDEDYSFIKRPFLTVPGAVLEDASRSFKFMTYNVLAQSLIRRELFPENGDALKWVWRRQVLAKELEYYLPDVLCMQEVDTDHTKAFWHPLLESFGHENVFTTFPGKKHGLSISYSKKKFRLVDQATVFYDEFYIKGVPVMAKTRNNGMLVALELIDDRGEPKGTGIIVTNCHMFWHPKGSYERTRQLAILMTEAIKFKDKYNWPVLLGGDYNSECFDTPYICATSKRPVVLDEESKAILLESVSILRPKFGKDLVKVESVNGDGQEEIESLVQYFNNLPYKATSVYGSAYMSVHPENIHPRSEGEPNFSNWAHAWRGLLDYIFVLENKNQTPSKEPSRVSPEVKVLELLRLPLRDEMGPEPSGQPRKGQYPSDHLCIMAKLEI